MKGFGRWLGRLGKKISGAFRYFMQGRYGTDKLNMYILGAGVVACVLAVLLPFILVDLILTVISYALMVWAIFRAFSRNTYGRYQENRRFLLWLERVKDREHKYFYCPKCSQPVRLPRGKGKIAITCPKCGEKFIRKT